MSDSQTRAQKIIDQIEAVSKISDDPTGITRTFCSPAMSRANSRVGQWMTEAGLIARVDNIGNLRGRLSGTDPEGQVFVVGSHLDTIINAGKFDGTLGVLLAVDAAHRIQSQGLELPFDLEVIGFSDEEGVRFHSTYLGSRVVAGCFHPEYLDLTDDNSISMRKAIENFGGIYQDLELDQIPSDKLMGYFEIHIEQGPVLEQNNLPVGLVSSISGQHKVALSLRGSAGHAGTTPMDSRQDALTGMAQIALEAERYARDSNGKLVVTMGKLEIYPGASNVIPGNAAATLDLRSPDPEVVDQACRDLEKRFAEIARKRHIKHHWKLIQKNIRVQTDPEYNRLLADAISESGFKVMELPSGAGHDAVALAESTGVAMLFVRCKGGLSHHPDEHVDIEDIMAAIKVCDRFFDKLIAR